jgi:hypothetical protein
MKTLLRILHLEDEPDFSVLVSAILEKEGLNAKITHVTGFKPFIFALENDSFDVIIADYSLPTCNGMQALEVARQKCPQVPFLLLSGAIGESAAVEILRCGATDYVLKSGLERLVPGIRRAVQETKEHDQLKHAEAELRQGEKQYRLLFDGNPIPMLVSDLKTGAILEVNEPAIRHYGYSRSEFLALTTGDICSPEENSKLLNYLAERSKAGIGHAGSWKHRKKDGAFVDVDVTWSIIMFQGHEALLTMAHDITERKRLEEQLLQSQKMEAIGQLAGGMAHDFNNILTVTHGHALLLLGEKNLSKSAKESAQQIAQAAERAAGLTRPLLAFSRRQVMQLRRLDLNEVLGTMTTMLGRMLGEDIVLQLKYWPQPAQLQANASMIEQVLLNLAVNARDAMPKGGQLAIEISVTSVGANAATSHPEAYPGEFVCLGVVDNGGGIAPENLRRIFEPFFTTKEAGKRTGLGLTTVYGIVKQHRGWIEAESELGKGASFRIFLPESKAKDGVAARRPAKQSVRGGTETILVVEDEAPVRELVCKLLSGYGYKVLQAETGVKALQVWRRSKGKIQLLLTDLVMPDRLNGRELAEQLRKNRPQLKVIFSSGYSADVVGKDFVLKRDQYFLQKPYDLQKLAFTVRSCLDGSKPGHS